MARYYQLDTDEKEIHDDEESSKVPVRESPTSSSGSKQTSDVDLCQCVLGSWRRRLPLTLALLALVLMMSFALSQLYKRIQIALHNEHDDRPLEQHFYDIHETCKPGIFRNPNTQLPTFTWTLPVQSTDGSYLKMPMYWTRPIDQVHPDIKQVVIIQHGNLRNANEYFCGALTSIQELHLIKGNHEILHNGERLDSVLIVAPHFLVEGDLCWNEVDTTQPTVSSKDNACGHLLWTSEGWKDGLTPINANAPPNFFSYDIFNLLVNHFSNQTRYPNVDEVVLFGFSAGGQTLLRYSMWPAFNSIPGVRVRSVVGDMSSYLYLDKRRPFSNGSTGFGIPDKDWILPLWNVEHSTGKEWITKWEGNCAKYNTWRYGLEELNGYFGFHSSHLAEFTSEVVREFPHRFIDYLVGLNDSANCNLKEWGSASIKKLSNTSVCNDNELATYCQAMLQGDNRFDRFVKWKGYLEEMFDPQHEDLNSMKRPNIYSFSIRGTNSAYYLVNNVSHDAIQMLRSRAAKCVVFGHCDLID